MSIAKIIVDDHKKNDKNVSKIDLLGKNKIKNTFKTAYAANILLEIKSLKGKGIKMYKSQFLLRKNGIRGINLKLSENDIEGDIVNFFLYQY